MLGSNSIPKNQKKNKNKSSNSNYTKNGKNKKIESNTYEKIEKVLNVYDIEQSTSKRKRRTIKIKNLKSNEKINNIDIIEDIDKVTTRFENNNEIDESNEKDILPPLSPISIASDNGESAIGINNVSTKEDVIIINENATSSKTSTSNHDTTIIDNNNDNEDVEIIGEKYVKYSTQPTVFETFSKNNVLWCHYCGTTQTSSWRHGPWGKKSLCNKHGCDYKGYGFTVIQPRLDLSKFIKETSKRIRPVIQEYCCVCFSNNSNKKNALVMCNGCYRSYHQECHPNKISSEIVNSSEPYYCKEECKHTREKKKIETDLPRKNLPFMFNRGIKVPNQKGPKSIKISLTKPKTSDKKSIDPKEVTPIHTPMPNSPAQTTTETTVSQEPQELAVEPEPKVIKSEIVNGKSSLDLIKEQRHLHRKRGGLKEEDKIVLYTKNLPPIVGFKHDEIPLPSWEIHNEDKIDILSNKGNKRKNDKEEMLEDISDEAYIKRHHPLELSEKYSRCGSLINTSSIDEEAISKMIEKQTKKRKLKKGYIYI
ncbi:hypothetical protein U3516DRAFT_833909 [Neocallimastix sp. 'constans']|jgi:hypothetical protein